MHTHFLGIDIAKSKFDCALLRPDGKVRNKVLPNNALGFTQLLTWLHAHGVSSSELHQLHVCMEATGIYWEALAEFLCDQSIAVSVINPAQIKSYGASRLMRSKTDKIDANLIAHFAKERSPAPWTAPAAHERVLRSLVLRLEALQNMLTQESNRHQVANPAVQPQIQNHIDWLNAEIKALAKLIKDHIDKHPDLRQKRDLLDTIPGIGERTHLTSPALCSARSRASSAAHSAGVYVRPSAASAPVRTASWANASAMPSCAKAFGESR